VLILVGNDESNGTYARLANELAIAHRVLFRGPANPPDLGAMLAACDVFVLPSRFDGWGVALNEAALMGRPLIASDRVGAAEHLVRDGDNGRIVRAGNVRALADALRSYMDHTDPAARHGRRSLAIAADFTPQRNVQRFVHALETWRASRSAARS
jgi:glycosyltransferase involved in cell wall biosynthesis